MGKKTRGIDLSNCFIVALLRHDGPKGATEKHLNHKQKWETKAHDHGQHEWLLSKITQIIPSIRHSCQKFYEEVKEIGTILYSLIWC